MPQVIEIGKRGGKIVGHRGGKPVYGGDTPTAPAKRSSPTDATFANDDVKKKYGEHVKKIHGLLDKIGPKIAETGNDVPADSHKWTGDLHHANEMLAEASSHVGAGDGTYEEPYHPGQSGAERRALHKKNAASAIGKLHDAVDSFHRGSNDNRVDYGHIGSLSETRNHLQNLHDQLHGEGQYAPRREPRMAPSATKKPAAIDKLLKV